MGSMVVWILWSGLLDSWDWLLYSAVGRAMSLLPCCLGSPIRQECALNLLVSEAAGFALQTGRAMVNRAVGCATRLPCTLVTFLVGQAEAVLSSR